MLTFTQIASSLTPAEVETIQSLLLDLPEADYSYIVTAENYIITREAAQRIMLVTQVKDHKALLENFVHWNLMSKEEQRIQYGKGDDFCEISTGVIGGTFFISIHRESDTESCYLTLTHDSEHVMMDIQIRGQKLKGL
mgnify:CR=1 FL=1|tara:strand:- start:201 stop:614 length:414 start_codon:yes stop_codon:yes gene_type:complete